MAKNYTNVNKNKNMEDSSYSSYADEQNKNKNSTTRTVWTRTAQIVRMVLHLHRRIVERTKIPTIKILLIRMDMIRQTDINLIEKAKRGIRREVTEETWKAENVIAGAG